MSGASRPSESAALQAELLARLGLPAGATPEQIDDVHYAVSQYLAAAPASLRPWAHAQAAALDAAYLTLTDPAGLQGSALRSPTRPPMVVPGGPATPPARRGLPAAAPAAAVEPEAADDAAAEDETAADEALDFESLYAAVTPSAHSEMGPEVLTAAERNRRKRAEQARVRAAAAGQLDASPMPVEAEAPWKRFALVIGGVAAVVALLFVGYNLGGGGAKPAASIPVAQATPSGPVVDQAAVATLMAKLQSNPNDISTLIAIGDQYYAGADYATAGQFYDKALVVNPKSVQALLARGAVYFNDNDFTNAEKTWKLVVAIEPNNQEVHYDLGFLYLNMPTPNMAGVETEWYAVVRIDPTTQLAQTVQSHLNSLVANSMIPSTPAPSGSASGSPAASGGASPAPSGSAAPSGSPAASTSGSVVNQTAQNTAFGSATLSAPANQAFTIHFDNQDAGVPHSIQIADPAGNVFFKGETVTGPKAIDYVVKALPAGSYPFHCSIHSSMTGTLTVGG